MNIPVIYIGLSQALFAALIIFLKRPLKISDVILGIWLIAIACLFGLNIFQEINDIKGDTWFFSLSISITFPSFLYLYSKYITVEFERFRRLDFLHASPFVVTVLLILIFRNAGKLEITAGQIDYIQLNWLRNYIGVMYVAVLWVYGILASIEVSRYKKQVSNIYSYNSGKISLNWLMIVVVSFIVLFSSIVVLSTLRETKIIHQDIDFFRNTMLLIYVYVLSIWGYRQNQLSSDIGKISLITSGVEKSELPTGKYQKSGLKSEQANEYLQKLIQHINQSEAWKDNELSVDKLSTQTLIPRHYITQVLNENLQKNFYNFVNEYRIEHAKKLIKLPKYDAWSLVAIAYESGFNSKTAFNNFFKKYTGLTPSEFKKNNEN